MKRKNVKKTRGRPFKPGNPGRPKGALNKVTLAVQALLDGQAEALTQKAIDLALGEDLTALRLCLERICPPRKSRPVNINLPSVETAVGIANAQNAVVQAIANGELTPEEGSIISGILEARRKTIETQDHETRLAALEAEAKKSKHPRKR